MNEPRFAWATADCDVDKRTWQRLSLDAATLVAAYQATVTGTALVSDTRVGRTLFDCSHDVTVQNGTPELDSATVTVTVTSSSPATVIVKGTVQLGNLKANSTTVSTDDFTIQQDRTVPFDPSALSFSVQGDPVRISSAQLIDQAQSGGAISLESALEYKVFAMFGDPRLPAASHGDDSAVFESDALWLVAQHWSELSAAAQAILLPFLVPPAYVGSWYSPAPAAAARQFERLAQSSAPLTSPCQAPQIASNWASVALTLGGHVRVWYDTYQIGDLSKAIADGIMDAGLNGAMKSS